MNAEASKRTVVVVEDSDEDFFALRRAMSTMNITNPVLRFERGEEALAHLRSAEPPAFVILDLNLPGFDGRDLLASLKSDAELRTIPVVVLTTSDNPSDVETCYRSGVNSYHVKRIDFSSFLETIRAIAVYWLEATLLPSPGSYR